jgi:regulator of protease activity HflC (stomatin/prohibitin superfamily)
VYRLGSLSESSIVQPGLHLKLPWPIDKPEIYDVGRERSLQIGYKTSSSGDFLWTVSHEGGEYTLLLGNGNELVAINAKLNYCIRDLYAYLTNNKSPENLISEAAYEILTRKTVTTTMDGFLREDRSKLSESMKNELAEYSDRYKFGLEIKNFVIQSIHPAVEVADVYQGVVGAGIKKQTLITAAETEAHRLIAEAEKERESAVISAMRNQTERVSAAQYEMAIYRAAYDAHRINRESFKLDKYLSVYEKIISGRKVYVFSPKAGLDPSNHIIGGADGSAEAIIID